MLDTAFWGCMLEHRIFLGSKGSVLFDRLQRSHRRGCGHMAYEGKMDYNYQLKIINGMAVEPNTDVRIDCPFCFHGNTFTLKNIDGKIMWNCFYASCNAKGIISKEMSPEELKNFLNGTIKELSAKNKVQLENKIKWNVPNYFTSVHSDNRALNYVKKNNCFNAMQKGLAKIMYDKIITTLLAVLLIIGGWTLSRTWVLSQNIEMVKEKVSKVEKQLDEAVWNALPESKEEEK